MLRHCLRLTMFLAAAACGAQELKPLSHNQNDWVIGNPLAWRFASDRISCVIPGGILPYNPAPFSRSCSIEAVVTPRCRVGESWAVAGVNIHLDKDNFWQLALVASPVEQNSRHFVELNQCSTGRWPYSQNLTSVSSEGDGFAWELNTPYRLRLTMADGSVTGVISTLDGKQCVRKQWRFLDDSAVAIGKPALRSSSLLADFQQVVASWGDAVSVDALANATQATPPPYFCTSFVADSQRPATGFFYTEQADDGSWWAVDPLGRRFVVFGIDHVTYGGHWCETLGYRPHERKNDAKYENQEEWAVETLGRLQDWGFNILAAGSSPIIRQRGLAHALSIGIGSIMATFGDEFDITPNERRPCSAFPNVFHPQFRLWCEYRIKEVCAKDVNNPWVFGYFIDNELAWWGRGKPHSGLFDAVLKKSPTHSAKIALRDFLKEQAGNDIAVFNRQWQQELQSFEQILTLDALPDSTPEQSRCKTDFLAIVADIYFRTVREVYDAVDPNHLLMACRFAGINGNHEVVWKAAGKYNDCVTWNFYGQVDLDRGAAYTSLGSRGEPLPQAFQQVYDWVQKPTIITEWSFPALDSGLPCTKGAGQRFHTQAERSRATDIYARTLLSMPFMIGYDYFMWVDEPALGISTPFPENTNYGMINEDGVPYPGMVKVFKAIQNTPAKARLQPLPPITELPPMDKGQLFQDYLQNYPRLTRSAPHPTMKTTLAGKAFTIDNGRISLSSLPDSPRIAIARDGKPLGTFNVMLNYLNDQGTKRWTDVGSVSVLKLVANDRAAYLEVTAEKVPDQQEQLADAQSHEHFTMTYLLVLPTNADYAIAQILSVKNLGATPLPLSGLFFRLYPDFEVQTKHDNAVPSLWSLARSAAWVAPDGQAFLGVAALYRQNLIMHFWKDEKRQSMHPDAYRPVDYTLPPQASYTPDTPCYLFVLPGSGDVLAMRKQADAIVAADRPKAN
ncbi:hypothetical protein [Oligosphaera ethanolica]|uniref:Glycoside hydrolase family 42 N-terminal domain-containing protein n=1 Tax=Oligosphaera ethanolica TaxID=760260 RepID=A0AAE3VIK9_9BACT|nr:hypothetical protein [Oligosphaera ethanolica]MDQ0291093.1 hypothetical protein [Oligosphaera ethanolica]